MLSPFTRPFGAPKSRAGAAFDMSALAYLIARYSARSANSFNLDGNGRVVAVSNLVQGGAPLNAMPDGGPTYAPSSPVANGRPAFEWPSANNALA